MKNVKKKLCMALSVAACLCAGVAVNANFAPAKVETAAAAEAQAANRYADDAVTLVDGASIRLDSQMSGIRFAVFMGDSATDLPYGSGKTLGVMIIPEVCLAEGETLEYGKATSKGYSAQTVEFDGNETRLADGEEKDGLANGRLFNAVLNLTGKDANYINNKYVARAYVLNSAGEVEKYLGEQISRAPAFVAAEAREVDTVDPDKVLLKYLEYVDITTDYVNVKKGETATYSATTNVEGIKISYSEVVDGKVTASFGKGAESKEIGVAELDNQHTFKNAYYTPEDAFKFDAYEVNEVKLGDDTLVEGTDYTYENNVLSVNKSLVVDADKELKVVSATAGDVTVALKAYTAALTGHSNNELQSEIFTLTNLTLEEETDGTVRFTVVDPTKNAIANFHPDYVKAMFAYPNMNKLESKFTFDNITYASADVMYYKSITTAGKTVEYPSGVASNTESRGAAVTRAMYNLMTANGNFDTNIGVKILPANLKENSTFVFDRVVAPRADGYTYTGNEVMVNHVYADVQAIMANGGYEYIASSEATLTSLKVKGSESVSDGAHTQAGSAIQLSSAMVSSVIEENIPFIITSYADGATKTAYAEELIAVSAKLFIDDSQYINKDEEALEGNYVLDLGDLTGQRVKSVKLNGTVLDLAAFDNGKVTVDKATLKDGHNVVEVKVERDVAHKSALVTAVDTYVRSICVYSNWELWSAMTFEGVYGQGASANSGRMNPFLSIVGANAETVSTAEIHDYYYSNGRTQQVSISADGTSVTATAQAATTGINNRAAMKMVIPANYTAKVYVSSKYYVARRTKVAEVANLMETAPSYYSELCGRVWVLQAEGSTWASWNFFVEDSDTDYKDASGSSSYSWTSFSNKPHDVQISRIAYATDPLSAVYDASTQTILKNYVYMQFNKNTSEARTLYIDEIFNAGNSPYGASARMPLSTIYQKAE